MSKTMMGLALVFALGAPTSGCNIENCEQGADCAKDGEDLYPPDSGESRQCLAYCNRLNVCGAPQAEDFDGCVAQCEVRLRKLPKETEELCACIVESRCEDAIEGHCTPPGDGSGGSQATGGGPGKGGSSSSGGASSAGGSTTTTGGSSNGSGGSSGSTPTSGAPGTGGAPSSGGSSSSPGGAACGGEPAGSAGDSSSAGTGAGPAGAGGDDPAVACTCDCDCSAEQACVDGYCSG